MVSIIVPVYKSELTLTRCVESLLMQDYADFEILLIVDGPPDGSGILAEQLQKRDARIRVINQPNQGVSHARNTGMAHAKGEYVRFVDSDDYVQKGELSKMVSRIEQDQSDLVICGYHHLYFGQTITKVPHMDGVLFVHQDFEDMKKLYQSGFLNMPWNKLFRKDRLDPNGFPENLSLGEDLVFNQGYIAAAKKISVMPICVCEYIQDDRGTTLSTKKRDDKIEMAVLLYEKSASFFESLYGDVDLMFLKEKVMTTFLDEIESIGFMKASSKEKKDSLLKYMAAMQDFMNQQMSPKERRNLRLPLLDYRIIHTFAKRNQLAVTYGLVQLRTLVVTLVRKVRRG